MKSNNAGSRGVERDHEYFRCRKKYQMAEKRIYFLDGLKAVTGAFVASLLNLKTVSPG